MLVPVHHGAEHDVLRKLLGLRLNHEHGVGGAGDDEVELRLGHLVHHRVQHMLAVDIADARGADGSEERHARERERGGRSHQGHDVRVVFHVVRQHGGDDLRLVLEALGEQRTDRPVDQARRERLLLGRASFTLEVAARDLARGEGLLLVIHGEGKEVDPDSCLFGRDDGGENGCIAIGGEHCAVGLAGDAPGLKFQRASAPINFYGVFIEHVCVPVSGER